ncbi:hypothetical protein [Noviherbaspirillum aerium]|nr:hypothetical protein [Noviherbaspirillum aerium]
MSALTLFIDGLLKCNLHLSTTLMRGGIAIMATAVTGSTIAIITPTINLN